MRIVISHDIDHLSVKEHYKDLIVPKFIGLCTLELLKNRIDARTYKKRLLGLLRRNAWNNLRELLEFDKEHKTKSTFFVAMDNALGLSYSRKQAEEAIRTIKESGFSVGVHGIEYMEKDGIIEEYDAFKRISGLDKFGVRMHYLRKNTETLKLLADAGYIYDATEYSEELAQPYKVDGMLEVPLHIMDGYLFLLQRRDLSLEQGIEYTKKMLDAAEKEDKIVTILFHQRYFSDEFPTYRRWYEWLIKYASDKGIKFASYTDLAAEAQLG